MGRKIQGFKVKLSALIHIPLYSCRRIKLHQSIYFFIIQYIDKNQATNLHGFTWPYALIEVVIDV